MSDTLAEIEAAIEELQQRHQPFAAEGQRLSTTARRLIPKSFGHWLSS
ncbi:MAG: hypothetical protein R3E79_38045 [Caldilineaceae bacterium]